MPDDDTDPASRFLEKAYQELGRAKFRDLLAFLTVRRIAQGSQHARFTKTFAGGLDELVEQIKDRATRPSDVATQIDGKLMQIVDRIRGKSPGGARELSDILVAEFDAYTVPPAERANEFVRALMIASSAADDETRATILARYEFTDELYAKRWKELLSALGRKTIPQIRSAEEFALILASVFDGFLARYAISGGDARVKELYRTAIVPIIGALTDDASLPERDADERLYGPSSEAITGGFERSPANATALDIGDVRDLAGTWRGVLRTSYVTRDNHRGPGPRRSYLVIDDRGTKLRITNYIDTGVSLMSQPVFERVGGLRRLFCAYEADVEDHTSAATPSHRGAWIVEEDASSSVLRATYFNEKLSRGNFRFVRHSPLYADSYAHAERMFEGVDDDDWS